MPALSFIPGPGDQTPKVDVVSPLATVLQTLSYIETKKTENNQLKQLMNIRAAQAPLEQELLKTNIEASKQNASLNEALRGSVVRSANAKALSDEASANIAQITARNKGTFDDLNLKNLSLANDLALLQTEQTKQNINNSGLDNKAKKFQLERLEAERPFLQQNAQQQAALLLGQAQQVTAQNEQIRAQTGFLSGQSQDRKTSENINVFGAVLRGIEQGSLSKDPKSLEDVRKAYPDNPLLNLIDPNGAGPFDPRKTFSDVLNKLSDPELSPQDREQYKALGRGLGPSLFAQSYDKYTEELSKRSLLKPEERAKLPPLQNPADVFLDNAGLLGTGNRVSTGKTKQNATSETTQTKSVDLKDDTVTFADAPKRYKDNFLKNVSIGSSRFTDGKLHLQKGGLGEKQALDKFYPVTSTRNDVFGSSLVPSEDRKLVEKALVVDPSASLAQVKEYDYLLHKTIITKPINTPEGLKLFKDEINKVLKNNPNAFSTQQTQQLVELYANFQVGE